jgi:hypothetical protein
MMTAPAKWLGRVTLGLATLIFLLIGTKYVHDPASAAAASGIALSSPLGFTNMRAGVGGFAFGCAIITLACLTSVNRMRTGLWFVIGMVAPVLVIRVYGVVTDGTLADSIRILIPETVLLVLAGAGIAASRAVSPPLAAHRRHDSGTASARAG